MTGHAIWPHGTWKFGDRGVVAMLIATVPPLQNFQTCEEAHSPDYTIPWGKFDTDKVFVFTSCFHGSCGTLV